MDNKMDEAVDAAGFAFCGTTSESMMTAAGDEVFRDAMLSALLAGMKVLLEPVVEEWRARLPARTVNWGDSDVAINQCIEELERVYAPSLGEGDGR